MLIASDGEAICGVWFYGQKHFPSTDFIVNDDLAIFKKVLDWFDDYFNGKNPKVNFRLKPHGSQFRQRVWKILSEIAQAVGGAVGHNPISIIVPCHRVLGKDGKLTGYAGGIDRKISLLELEGIDFKN